MPAPVPGWPTGPAEAPREGLVGRYLDYRDSYSKNPATGWSVASAGEWRSNGRPVEIRTYRAKSMAEASRVLEAEAEQAYAAGYTIAAQNWAPGQWSAGAFLLAVLLILAVGLGLLILAYLVIVKPAGTLTVTFTRG